MAGSSTVRGSEILVDDINKMIRNEKACIAAINSVLVAQKKRIFEAGRNSYASKIGDYSTKPTRISRKRQTRYVGKTKFEGGYKEYKTLLGKGGGPFVNLRETDQMMFDLSTSVNGDEYSIGFQNEVNADKAKWMEDKYDAPIFDTTGGEDDIFTNILAAELDKI